jgi:hypothetical protein
MSEVINPPEYYFTGINFNPAFYAEDAGDLSQALANTLYLRKTVPDTATAQETFTAGIKTSSIASTGTGASNILNIGIDPRTVLGAIHHYSDGDNCVSGAGVHINNGTNNNSATNIHNGTGANPSGIVNIMTGTSNSGTVNIGTTGTTTNVNGLINVNKPITIGYSTTPTTGQLGEVILIGSSINNIVAGNNILCISNISKGTWLINAQIYWDGYALATGASCSIIKGTNNVGVGGTTLFNFYGGRTSVGVYVEVNTGGTQYYTLTCFNSSGTTQSCFSGSTAYTYMSFTRVG